MISALWKRRPGCPNRRPSTRCCTGVNSASARLERTLFLPISGMIIPDLGTLFAGRLALLSLADDAVSVTLNPLRLS
jgi:hypothetical protein